VTKIRTGDVVRTLTTVYTRAGKVICPAGTECVVFAMTWRGAGEWTRLTPTALVEVEIDGLKWWPTVGLSALQFVRRPRRRAAS